VKKNRKAVIAAIAVTFALFCSAAQAQSGALKVTSFPSGAKVSIDGADTGKTTPMSISLAVGDHTVVVSIPNSGWNPDTRTVTIVSGNNDLSVTLLPILTIGPQGPQGPKGDTGATGAQGAQGLKGDKGEQGVEGVPGSTGAKGDKGDKGEKGDTGDRGPVGATGGNGAPGLAGAPGPSGPALSGMQEFAAASVHQWTAPAGVTHVLFEMWGGGGGGGPLFSEGGGGGAYTRGIVPVLPGTTYLIAVGKGGQGNVPFEHDAEDGAASGMLDGNNVVIFAGGGVAGGRGGFGGAIDPSAAVSRNGGSACCAGNPIGASAFGANFCPGPNAEKTGRGGDLYQEGQAGYVLLTW
jgi:hypothetical protein